MNFDWNPEESEIRKRVADLFDRAANLEIESLEASDPPGLKDLTLKYLQRLSGTGYLDLGPGPEKTADMTALIGAQEKLAGISGSLFLAVEVTARLFGGLVAGWGGPEVKDRILEPLLSGTLIGAVALAEPGGHESAEGPTTVARETADGCEVTGRKSFVTNGPIADWLAVSGELDGRLCFFLIRSGQDGLTVGPRMMTMGHKGLAVSTLELSDAPVPKDRIVGPFPDRGPLTYLHRIQDLILAMASLGVCERILAAANEHAHSHHRGNKPIYAHQEVRFKLADMFTLYQTSQLLAYRAGWFLAVGDRGAGVLVHCAKVFIAEASERVATLGMQILAGQGYLSGNAVEKGYREAKYAALAGTTSEISRMKIADEVLKQFPA